MTNMRVATAMSFAETNCNPRKELSRFIQAGADLQIAGPVI